MSDLQQLRHANIARDRLWNPYGNITLLFRGVELGGECGEALNLLKKIEREAMGLAGSRSTVEDAMEELADIVICADLVAMHLGGDLAKAVEAKFNKTSDRHGFDVHLDFASDVNG